MRRLGLYLGIALVLVAAGLTAYLLGRTLRPVQDELSGTALQNLTDVRGINLTSAGGEVFSFGALEDALIGHEALRVSPARLAT